MCHRAETVLPCGAGSARRARHWVRDQLAAMYGQLDQTAQDTELVVSELVTNATQAHCRVLVLAVEAHHTRLSVAATDDAPGSPILHPPPPDAAHGRGLVIVEALSERWGVDAGDARKTVWAEIPLPASAAPSFDCTDTTT